jgi:hypothetical protein
VLQQIGRADVMRPPAHFEQLVAIGKIEAPPAELQIEADDNSRASHLTSDFDCGNYAGEAPIVFPERALRLAEGLIRRTFLSPRFAARDFVVHCLRKLCIRVWLPAHGGFLSAWHRARNLALMFNS